MSPDAIERQIAQLRSNTPPATATSSRLEHRHELRGETWPGRRAAESKGTTSDWDGFARLFAAMPPQMVEALRALAPSGGGDAAPADD